MNFAEALARIEKCLNDYKDPEFIWKHKHDNEIEDLLRRHRDSIVQLAKVAEEMRAAGTLSPVDEKKWRLGAMAYDKLMKGE